MNRKRNQREESGLPQAAPFLPLEENEAAQAFSKARAKQETPSRQEADRRLHADAQASLRESLPERPGVGGPSAQRSTAYADGDPLRRVRANAAQLADGAWKSAREAEAAVWMASQDDAVMRNAAYAKLDQRYETPGDSLYAPYRHATNQALIDNMAALGYDVSGGVNDDFFTRNAGLMQSYRTGANGVSNTPQAPTKSSTAEEDAAYYYYQLLKDEETTRAAESEWEQMQREARYWTRKGLSDEEVIAKVNGQGSKYRTLRAMDENASLGTPTQLNRPVDYSQDNLYGVIWAERNGDDSGDYRSSAVRAALGQGAGYARDIGREQARDASSAAYNPYRYGGNGLDDAALYFGVDGFEDAGEWLDANAGLLNGDDEQAARYYKQVYAAHQNTKEARAELDSLYAWARARLAEGASVDAVKQLFELRWDEKALDDDTLNLSVLRAMDKGREISGTPVALTGAVDYRKEDFLRWLDSQGGSRVPRKAVAAAVEGAQASVAKASEDVASSTAETAATEAETPTAFQRMEAQPAIATEQAAVPHDNQALIDQREEYIDSYNGLLRAAQTNPLSVNREILAETREAIDRLSEQIGDGYVAKVPYTMEQAHGVLSRALAGQKLTEEEKRVFDSFYADNPYLFPYGSFSHDEESRDFLQTDAAQYPAMEKTKETLYERARQDYETKWAVGDPSSQDPTEADAAAGLGFFRTLGLGVSSGAKSWWAGKVGFAAMLSDTGEAYTASANYQAYTGEYGLADARYFYRQDVTAAIAAMDDSDPNKAVYQAMLENDGDIFALPFNFTYEALSRQRRKINAEIQANADLVRKFGTAMENTVYDVSTSVTQNSLLMGEAALVNAVAPGSGAVGVAASYGSAEWQETYFDARARGASRTQAKVLGLLHAGITTALEGVMYDRYIGEGADRVIGKLTGPVNRALGTMAENAAQSGGKRFLARAGQLGVALLGNAAGEGVQENVENVAAGAIDAMAYQDPAEFLATLNPATVKDTFLNAMVVSLFLSGEGQLIQAGGKALAPKPDAAVKYLDYAAETALLDPELRQELTEARSA